MRKLKEEINLAIEELNAISLRVSQNQKLLQRPKVHFSGTLYSLEDVVAKNTDWRQYTQEQKAMVGMAVKYAQAVVLVVDTPILGEDGRLTYKSEDLLENRGILTIQKI